VTDEDKLTQIQPFIDLGNQNYLEALKNKNATAYANCFTKDGALLLPNQPKVRGRESILQVMENSFKNQKRNIMGGGDYYFGYLFYG